MSDLIKKRLEAIGFTALVLVLLLGVVESAVYQNGVSVYWIGMIHGFAYVSAAVLIGCIGYAIAAWHFSEKKEEGS